MPSKAKPSTARGPVAVQPAKLPLKQPVLTQAAIARRPLVAVQPAAGTANHSRHHVSRHAQS